MKFQELVSISGLPGLFQLVATKSDGAIVKSIDDNITKFVAARSHSVTALDGVEVFTTGENERLLQVFLTMQKNMASAGELDLAKANNDAIKAHFAKLYPIYDKDRVYVSDMKKMIKWLAILDAKGLIVEPVEEVETEEVEANEEVKKAPKKEKKTEEEVAEKPKKEKAPKKEKEVVVGNASETPKPKKVAKKKTEEKSAE